MGGYRFYEMLNNAECAGCTEEAKGELAALVRRWSICFRHEQNVALWGCAVGRQSISFEVQRIPRHRRRRLQEDSRSALP